MKHIILSLFFSLSITQFCEAQSEESFLVFLESELSTNNAILDTEIIPGSVAVVPFLRSMTDSISFTCHNFNSSGSEVVKEMTLSKFFSLDNFNNDYTVWPKSFLRKVNRLADRSEGYFKMSYPIVNDNIPVLYHSLSNKYNGFYKSGNSGNKCNN